MATIPRGIQVVQWRNADKKKQQRYRVRINKKSYQCDKLFDTLDEAIKHLADSKSLAGVVKIREYDKEAEQQRKAISDFLSSPPFEVFVKAYIEKYIDVKDDGTELKKRNVQSDKSRLTSILNTEVEYVSNEFKNLPFVMKAGMSKRLRMLKEFKLEEIDDVVITNFIYARLNPPPEKKKPALSTVKRDVDTLSGIFTKIRHIDKSAYLTKLKGDNPCSTADLTLLKGWDVPRKKRIKPELEEVILKALKEFPNKEMLLIFCLAMTTGMRRSELLMLKWTQIDFAEKKIFLTVTKSNKPREVSLTDEAIEVINNIPKKDERLFHYTIDGMNCNWQKIKNRSGFKGVRWHDTRREFISKMLQMCSSSIVVADMIGMDDINHFEKHYAEDEVGLNTQAQLMKSVGHDRKSTTKGYFTK